MPDPAHDSIKALFFTFLGNATISTMSRGLRHGYHIGAFLYQDLDVFPGQLGNVYFSLTIKVKM